MSQPDLVQPGTLERIRVFAAQLGYVPNRRARALVSGHSDTIGVVVPTLNSPIFSSTLQEMQRAFAAGGYQLLIASHEYNAANEAAAVSQLLSHGVDGLVVIGADRPQSTWTMIDGANIPLVQMWEGRSGHDRVTVDSFQAGFLVARYLLDIGHTRFGVICGHLIYNDRQKARVAGIRAALAEAGLTLARTHISEQALTIAAGRAGCIGAMFEAQGRGAGVPAAISLAGIDNVDVAAHVSPSLTTVDIPAASIGAETAALMLRRLQDGTARSDTAISLPVNLIVRHSTARPGDE